MKKNCHKEIKMKANIPYEYTCENHYEKPSISNTYSVKTQVSWSGDLVQSCKDSAISEHTQCVMP